MPKQKLGTEDGGLRGWHLIVAIADVAWYVRPGSELDREARERGNSVYFPDRVIPMLPEALSKRLVLSQTRRRPPMSSGASLDQWRR